MKWREFWQCYLKFVIVVATALGMIWLFVYIGQLLEVIK